ncbi:MAG: hypothetical protein KZQ94_15915 [Candidatus Thiodiazotropha sp. (ex Troendleina suluensis)]|nr:hypothetical protein [Candidatus Thiodiazotropha sp. (ex Troendleina suluensis)]
MKIIHIKGVGDRSFPDSMSNDEIKEVLRSKFGSASHEPEERSFINDLGRNAGVAARGALEAPVEFAGLFTDPFTSLSNKYLGTDIPLSHETASGLVDYTGLPKPESAQERIVNTTAKMMSSVGGQSALVNALFKNAGPIASKVAQSFTANPTQQVAGAVAGGASAQAAKEIDMGPWGQLVAGLAGGMAGSAATIPIQGMVTGLARNWALYQAGKQGKDQALAKIKSILDGGGIDITSMPASELDDIVREVTIATKRGIPIKADVVKRIAQYSQVSGAIPTTGRVTLDPKSITTEKNAAKYGVNSSSGRLQTLSKIENNNNAALIDDINRLGADQADDAVAAGVKIKNALIDIDQPRSSLVNEAYQRVKDHSGRSAQMDTRAFSQKANDILDKEQLGTFLPTEIRTILNRISDGTIPFTANTMMQYDKILSKAQRAATDGNVRTAVGMVRNALNDTPVHSSAGRRAINQYQEARTLAKKRFELIEKNPALESSLVDDAPDKFVNTFLVGQGNKANVRDVTQLASELRRNAPEMLETAKQQILLYLKNKALGGATDEVGKFSSSNFTKALNNIGLAKLSKFFTKKEIAQLKAIRAVASYETFQPRGAAINNSNTASAASRIAQSQTLGGLPLGQLLQGPARFTTESRAANEALNILSSITGKQGTSAALPLGSILPILSGIDR